MKDLTKEKVVTGLVVLATVMLGGVAIYTGIRLFQLRNQSVALNSPEKSLASGPNVRSCTLLAFALAGENTPTPVPGNSPTSTPTNSPTPVPSATLTPTTPASTSTPTPTQPAGSTPTNTPTPTTGYIAEISPTTPVYTSTPTPTTGGSTVGRQIAQSTPTPDGETLMSSGVPEVTYIFGLLGVIGFIIAISLAI